MTEYSRLLAWSDAAGLIEIPNGSHVASSLGTNAVEIFDIPARIAWLLEKFKEINNQWHFLCREGKIPEYVRKSLHFEALECNL